MSTTSTRNEPTDKNVENLAGRGLEDPNKCTPKYRSTLGKHIRDKVHSDMQPTDPQNNIKSTGNCELGNRQVDRIRPPPVQEASHDTST